MHQSDWGGEMWWCCGKKDREHPGCKYSKHESREDDLEYDIKKNGVGNKNMKCVCCKEFGHSIENCAKDPNFKTLTNVFEE